MSPVRAPAGFTLVEILVSIGIFMVSATLMLSALFGATEVFRRGEAARQAGDEATAVIAALQEDLSRTTPVRLRDGLPAPEWGHITASVDDASGNCRLTLVIENADRAQVRWMPRGTDQTVVGLRKRVVWRVGPGADPADAADDELIREEYELGDDGAQVGGVLRQDVVTRGCLHFSVWFELAQTHRTVAAGPAINWEASHILPYADDPATPAPDPLALDTSTKVPDANGVLVWPLPDAVRVSLVLTGGGRYATRGYLVDDSGTQVRLTGVKALTTLNGSLLRLGGGSNAEWIRYDDFRGGMLTGVLRGQLRSRQSGWGARTPVYAGQPFSLVAELPR